MICTVKEADGSEAGSREYEEDIPDRSGRPNRGGTNMKKNITRKILAALMVCMMFVSAASVLPITGVKAEEAAEAEAVTVEMAEATETEETAADEIAGEEILPEEAAAEEAAVEETLAEETVVEETVAEETVVEETVAEETVVEEIVVEETAAEVIPAEDEAATEETAVEETAAEELLAKETIAEETIAEEEPETVVAEEDEMIFDDYETPLGIIAQNYAFERDANGALVLDGNGNPVVIPASEEDDIPVAFLRDAEGALVLDPDGNPIVTQTIPANAVKISTLEDRLDPNRSIDIYYSWDDGKATLGGTVTFHAVLHGYENAEYTIQWQQSKDNENWSNIQDAEGLLHPETITRDNYQDFWRVQVTITGAA